MKKKNRSILIGIQKLCSGQKILTKTTLQKQTNKEKNSDAEKNTVLIFNSWATHIQSIGENLTTTLHCG